MAMRWPSSGLRANPSGLRPADFTVKSGRPSDRPNLSRPDRKAPNAPPRPRPLREFTVKTPQPKGSTMTKTQRPYALTSLTTIARDEMFMIAQRAAFRAVLDAR